MKNFDHSIILIKKNMLINEFLKFQLSYGSKFFLPKNVKIIVIDCIQLVETIEMCYKSY